MKTDNEKFKKKCVDCVEQSKIDIYKLPNHSENDDQNYLHFDHYNEDIHGPIRRSWLQQKVCILLNYLMSDLNKLFFTIIISIVIENLKDYTFHIVNSGLNINILNVFIFK